MPLQKALDSNEMESSTEWSLIIAWTLDPSSSKRRFIKHLTMQTLSSKTLKSWQQNPDGAELRLYILSFEFLGSVTTPGLSEDIQCHLYQRGISVPLPTYRNSLFVFFLDPLMEHLCVIPSDDLTMRQMFELSFT